MKTVYKYPISLSGDDVKVIRAPAYFYPLRVDLQGDTVCLWAIVDTETSPAEHSICVAGTGHKLSDEVGSEHYIGTVQFFGGEFVLHFFWLD